MKTPSNPSKTQLELIFDTLFSKLKQFGEYNAELIDSLKIIANENNFKSAQIIEKALNAVEDQDHENSRA